MAPSLQSEHVRWFRLRRSGLVEPFGDAADAAARLIGVQAQMPAAAELALWNRCRACGRGDLEAALTEQRTLVRLWGQRDTVHLYRTSDWPLLHTLFEGRRTLAERRLKRDGLWSAHVRLVRRTERKLESGALLTYEDVQSRKLESASEPWVVAYSTFMALARRGVACHGPAEGGRSTFVHRDEWLPHLAWDPPPPEIAFPTLARRYFAAYGPAGAADLAFWAGATLTEARAWIEAAGDDLAGIEADGDELVCRGVDLPELKSRPPVASRWPVRLLHRFDPLLLATKDKSRLIDACHYKKVWRPAAHVEAVVLVAGRIVATWRYERRRAGLLVRIMPFEALRPVHRRRIADEAKKIAAFLQIDLEAVDFATGD